MLVDVVVDGVVEYGFRLGGRSDERGRFVGGIRRCAGGGRSTPSRWGEPAEQRTPFLCAALNPNVSGRKTPGFCERLSGVGYLIEGTRLLGACNVDGDRNGSLRNGVTVTCYIECHPTASNESQS